MIEASAVCKHWYDAAHSNIKYCSKFQEMKYISLDKGWLLKSYEKEFDRFRSDLYWEIINC